MSQIPASPASPPRPFKWVRWGNVPHNIANNVIYSMEAALLRAGFPHVVSPRNSFTYFCNRGMAKAGIARKVCTLSRSARFIPCGQVGSSRFVPSTFFHEIIPWCIDSWPNMRAAISKSLRQNRVRIAFFSARQSADFFRQSMGIDAVWLPEACEPTRFNPSKRLKDRSIDVLELGRRHDPFHEAVTPVLETAGRTHLYGKYKGHVFFPTDQALCDGLADSKISVCFPSSITHPERSGDCETVTLRYFESMAAGCLMVGHGPAELLDIFGYNPVIEADPQDPGRQILEILDHIDRYQDMVDKNHQAVLQRGTWDVRVRELLAHLEKRGFYPG